MGRHCQMVMGPAGSGKSTYCATMMTHCQNVGRTVHLVNLDPAAERFEYQPTIGVYLGPTWGGNIRDLITLDDVMEELQFLLNNIDWLEEALGSYEDDYLIFDCPGQIELYTHFPIMRRICENLQRWNFAICGVYLLESQFIEDKSKYFSGVLSAMSAMINLEIPHVNIMTKMDLIQGKAGAVGVHAGKGKKAKGGGSEGAMRGGMRKKELERYLDPDPLLLVEDVNSKTSSRFHSLNQAIVQLRRKKMILPLPFPSIDRGLQYGELHPVEQSGRGLRQLCSLTRRQRHAVRRGPRTQGILLLHARFRYPNSLVSFDDPNDLFHSVVLQEPKNEGEFGEDD
ncbi:hypothetical protein BC938DRAFT_473683 [Jimgerdemannia flammicorona]|uniref:GPN-loop GTPase 3 n=1 Tax=Jimgerdemannia flammicorona TaxID=994334 RepID=A0A433QT62_9FUNG|nr:hypothetical protein BC938DRAFT_473683 [Jimgerdemannia flammicorona]